MFAQCVGCSGGAPGPRGPQGPSGDQGGALPSPGGPSARRASGHSSTPGRSLRGRQARSFSRSSVPGGALTGHASESGGRRAAGSAAAVGRAEKTQPARACDLDARCRPGPRPEPAGPAPGRRRRRVRTALGARGRGTSPGGGLRATRGGRGQAGCGPRHPLGRSGGGGAGLRGSPGRTRACPGDGLEVRSRAERGLSGRRAEDGLQGRPGSRRERVRTGGCRLGVVGKGSGTRADAATGCAGDLERSARRLEAAPSVGTALPGQWAALVPCSLPEARAGRAEGHWRQLRPTPGSSTQDSSGLN